MAHGTKYRCSFADMAGTSVQVDLKKEDYSSTVTSIVPAYPALSIEWPSERGDIFHPVRGATATLRVWASSSGQFSEFFDSYDKEWQMEVTIDGNVYWTGWVMIGEHQEAFEESAYMVQFRAFDLGYLQDEDFDYSREEDDSIIDVLEYCLSETELSLSINDRVNIYEDSHTTGAGYSPLDQTNIHQPVYFDDDWTPDKIYTVLEKILIAFNSFLIQENNYWNIVRVPDMARSHNYRVWSSGSVGSSGSEDTSSALSGYNIINRSGLIMAASAWRNAYVYQDYGYKNLCIDGRFEGDIAYTDVWTQSVGSSAIQKTSSLDLYGITDQFDGWALKISYASGSSDKLDHDKSYSVTASSGMNLLIRYRFIVSFASGGPATGGFYVYIDAGTDAVLQADGSWGTVSTDTDNYSCANKTWVEGEIVTDEITTTGDLKFQIHAAYGGTGTNYTFWDYFEVYPLYGSKEVTQKSFRETLSVKNTFEPEAIMVYHGDSQYADTEDLYLGSLTLTSGAATDDWQSTAGSPSGDFVELCRDCYKAQYIHPARRLQAVIKGLSSYLTVLTDSSSRAYLASSMTYHVDENQWQGEWIEIKTGWGDNLVDDGFTNGGPSSNNYDTLSQIDVNEVTITKTQTSTVAQAYVEDIPISSGVRYRVTVVVEENGTSDIPEFTFAGDTTQLELGTNEYDVISTSTSASHDAYLTSAAADTCNINLVFTIQEAYGL